MYWPTHREFLNSLDEILSEGTGTGTAGHVSSTLCKAGAWAVAYSCKPNYNKLHLDSPRFTSLNVLLLMFFVMTVVIKKTYFNSFSKLSKIQKKLCGLAETRICTQDCGLN
jgi:hypothetical protein